MTEPSSVQSPEEAGGEQAEPKPYPGFWSAVGLLLLELLAAVLVMAVVFAPARLAGLELRGFRGPLTLVLRAIVAAVILVFAYCRSGRPHLAEIFPWKPVPSPLVGPMIMSLVGIQMLAVLPSAVARALLGRPAVESFPMDQATMRAWPWAAFLLVVILAPVSEELLFRGVMMRGFLKRYTERRAILANAVLFGLVHLDLEQMLPAAAVGALFAWWRARTGSLRPSLIGHALVNLVPLLAMLPVLLGRAHATSPQSGADPSFACMASLALTGAVLTWAGVSYLRRQFVAIDAGALEDSGDSVKCPRCGWATTSSAARCFNCGAELAECDQCGATVLTSADRCHSCGEAFEN